MKKVARPRAAASGVTRRHFMQTSAAAGTTALMLPHAQAAGTSLEGYTAAPSAMAGGTMDFFLRDPQAVGTGTTAYPITFTRVGAPDVYMTSTTINIGNQVVPADASTNGCRWARTYRLSIPSNWPSGLYYAFVGSGSNACTVPFVVRPVSPTAGVKTIVNVPVLTVHAYNAYGGKSIYDFNSTGGVRASQVSLDRPFTETFNSFFDVWSQYLVRWMAKNNLAADFCTDVDIEINPSLLTPYQLYVQAGHDEYWSNARRNTMDAFVNNGGNCAYLGGNTSWFQSRLEAGVSGANRTLVSYKDAAADPVTDPALKTINFISLATPRPENLTTGLGFVTGCSWAGAQPRPNTPSVVMRPEHWAFAGTGLGQGTGFGGTYVGYECDAAAFNLGSDQRPYPTGVDGSPATLRILASADATTWNDQSLALGGTGELSGYAMVAVFSRGGAAGTVFNAGATDWAYGLIPEINGQTPTPISRITLNVIKKLVGPWSETADVRQFRSVVGGVVNTYYGTGTVPPSGSGMTLDGWAFRGYPGLEAGTVPVYRFRSTTSNLAQRAFYLSTNATVPSGMALDAVAFYAYASARSDAVAVYEHYAFNGSLQLWVAYYSTSVTPPAGFSAGPIRFYAPTDGTNAATPTPYFTLTANPTSIAAVQGQTGTSAVTVNQINGFTGTVSFTTSGLPAGVTSKFSSDSSDGGTTVKLTPSAATAPGSYQVMVNGVSGSVAASVMVTLVVSAAPSFTLAANPTSLRLPFNALFGGSVDVNVTGKNGFNAAVSFSVSGVPAGLVASFVPASATSTTQLCLSKALFPLVSPGNYTLTITGTSGSLTATTTLPVVVALLL